MRLERKKRWVCREIPRTQDDHCPQCTAQHMTSAVQLLQLQPFPFCPMGKTWRAPRWNRATENIETRWVVSGLGGIWVYFGCLGFFFVWFVVRTVIKWNPLEQSFLENNFHLSPCLQDLGLLLKKKSHYAISICIPNRTLVL